MLTVFHNSYIYICMLLQQQIVAKGIGIAKESAWKHHLGSDHGNKAGCSGYFNPFPSLLWRPWWSLSPSGYCSCFNPFPSMTTMMKRFPSAYCGCFNPFPSPMTSMMKHFPSVYCGCFNPFPSPMTSMMKPSPSAYCGFNPFPSLMMSMMKRFPISLLWF